SDQKINSRSTSRDDLLRHPVPVEVPLLASRRDLKGSQSNHVRGANTMTDKDPEISQPEGQASDTTESQGTSSRNPRSAARASEASRLVNALHNVVSSFVTVNVAKAAAALQDVAGPLEGSSDIAKAAAALQDIAKSAAASDVAKASAASQ